MKIVQLLKLINYNIGEVMKKYLNTLIIVFWALQIVPVNGANMLYKSNFGPDETTLAVPIISSVSGSQDITGINVTSGKKELILPWGATKSCLQLIADTKVTSSSLNSYIKNEIQQVTGPNGNQIYALFQNLKINNAAPPTWGSSQDPLMIRRESVASGDRTDTGDVYYTYWFKFQSDLHTQLGTNGGDSWRVLSEWKTGGLNNTMVGDYRIITTVIQDGSGHIFWRTTGDNVANGIPTKKVYWQVNNNAVSVPVGQWFKYEVFWHRSSGIDGRYWAAVNGDIIVDHKGPNMGIYNLPINRIMLNNNYSGGKAPSNQWTTDLEIWDGFPCGEGISCYGSNNFINQLNQKPKLPISIKILSFNVTNIASNSVVLNWTTSSPTTGVISFSRDMQFNNKMTDSKLTTNHSFIIKALSESMKYFYKITAYSENQTTRIVSPVDSFTTQ